MTLMVLLGLTLMSTAIVSTLYWRLNRLSNDECIEVAVDREAERFLHNSRIRGLVIGVYKQGKCFSQGYGSLSKFNTVTPDEQSVFQLASVSKLLTTTTLQILCDQGLVDMDATLEQILGDTMALAPSVRSITLRQLATHTAGFTRVPRPVMEHLIHLVGKKHLMGNPYQQLQTEVIWDYLQNPVDKRKPGTFHYSNYGMGLLGHVLEHITTTPLETLVREKLLQPLGMLHTGINLTPSMQAKLVPGHDGYGDPTPLWTFGALAGAGGFSSCVTDMLAFIRANLDNSAPLAASLQRTHHAQASGKTGLGWMQATWLDRFVGNRHIIWHDGQVGGYTSYLSIDPHHHSGVIILSNTSQSLNALGLMLMQQIRTQSWQRASHA